MSLEAHTLLGRILPRIGKPRKKSMKRTSLRRRFGRRLGAEMLEDRSMLAGILSVTPDSAMAGTDDLLVTDDDGATLIDSIEFGVQTTDVSYGRYLDGTEIWDSMATPTPGAANALTNVAPTAEAGGTYAGDIDATIALDGTASTDTDGTIALYEWDLDNDGQYDDATGATANFSSSTVGTFTIGLQVTDDDDATDTDTATIIVTELDVSKPGDANRDGVFNSTDLIQVFQAGEYEDGVSDNSDWEEGDWNGDGDFGSSDMVWAFQAGHYVAAAAPLEGQIAWAVDWLFALDDDVQKTRPPRAIMWSF